MSMENYQKVHRLGKGGCGAVFLVRDKESRKLFALKTIDLDERKKTRTKDAVEKEARILAQLKHPHIVLYHDSFFDEENDCLCIIQDYCDGGTLDDKIKTAAMKSNHFEQTQIMEWFLQIIMAVQYIHSKKVLHRDLKAENVFLTKRNVIKIGDFGISKVLENTVDVAQTIVGTPSYLSPELCQDIPYSSKSDIWAVGCLLYEMCALRSPFDAANLISLFFKIIKAEYEPIPNIYSKDLQDLVSMILVKSPDDRPSASAILNTTLVKHHLAMFIQQKENLLQQKSSKDESLTSPGAALVARSKSAIKSGNNSENASPALKRNKLKISNPVIQKPCPLAGPGDRASSRTDRSPHGQDSGLGVSCETDILKSDRLQPPKPDADASSDYSDDFDESSNSEVEEDLDEVEEEIEGGPSTSDSDQAPIDTQDAEYDDDFEEYDSSDDLDQLVNQAREAQDIEAVNDWFADSLSEMQQKQTELLRQQCKVALGGRGLREVERLVSDGTLTEEDLRPELRRSIGGDRAEICHFSLDDLG